MSFSVYLANELLDHAFGKGTSDFPSPTTLAVSLHTGDPGTTGANEVANSNNYARAAVTFDAASSGQKPNADAVTFPTASGSWGTITHVGIWDSVTHGAGNFLGGGALSQSKEIDSGDAPEFGEGDLVVVLT